MVSEWSAKWKMSLNTSKCETTAFTTDPSEASWSPQLTINGQPLAVTTAPRFLRITFDRRLTFRTHAQAVAQEVTRRSQLLRALTGTSWGCRREDLRALFLGFIRPVADYCGAVRGSGTAPSNMALVERAQNRALQAVTGLPSSTPVCALRCESHVPSYATRT